MDYSLIAGLMCTCSLVFLFIENIKSSARYYHPGFCIFYGIGLCFWLSLGLIMNQSGLIIISLVQMLGLFSYYRLVKYAR